MHKSTLVVLALLSGSASAEPARRVAPAPAPASAPAPAAARSRVQIVDEGDLETAKGVRASLADADKLLRPIIKADPRVASLTKDIRDALKLKDQAARRKQLESLVPRMTAVRNDALGKAGLNARELEKKVQIAQTSSASVMVRDNPPPPPPPGSVISSVTITSFPSQSGSKTDCPDEDDTYDFDGNVLRVDAVSTPADADCWGVKAGKGGTVEVPEGTKRVSVSVQGDVHLNVAVASLGIFGEAQAYLGLRISSPDGVKLSNNKTWMKKELKVIHAEAFGPIPFALSDFTDELQSGDSNSHATFEFAGDPGDTLRVSAYIGGWADADLIGVAEMHDTIVHKSLKVTFYR